MKIACALVLSTTAGIASAQFFGVAATANGDWDAAAPGPIMSLDIGQSLGALTAGVPVDLGGGVSAVANGPDASNDSVGFGVTLGGSTTEFTLMFDTAISAVSFDIANGNVTNGLTIDTGLNTYDMETLNGGPVIGAIGIVESGTFNSVTFRVTNPAGATDLFFLDEPLRYAVPTPASAGLLGLGGVMAARRRRHA